jgi:hypothetical protein
MAEKKAVYQIELSAQPPLPFLPGDESINDPDLHYRTGLISHNLDPKMEASVKRLIAYLKDEKLLP